MKSAQGIFRKILGRPLPIDDVPAEFLQPISNAEPAGANLEYDNDYGVLRTSLEPRADVQYGDFISHQEGPDWAAVERECRRLLARSKDISVLIWWLRSRTRQAGASGFAQGIGTLFAVLKTYEQEVHPQLLIDGVIDPAVRANALAALGDPEGLLGDVREIVLSSGSASRLTMRDVERAHALPRVADAMDPDAVRLQLSDLFCAGEGPVHDLLAAREVLQEITAWAQGNMADEAPDLRPLRKMLGFLDAASVESARDRLDAEKQPAASAGVLTAQAHEAGRPLVPNGLEDGRKNPAQEREQIRLLLAQVRQWIERNEPSSPAAVLLKQAERLWGKKFSQVAHVIPHDLLQAWDRDE